MIALNVRKRRHAARAVLNGRHDFVIRQPIRHIYERWKCRWRPGPVDSVTHRALALIERFPWAVCAARRDRPRPNHLRLIDVDDPVDRIDCRAAPFRATIKAGEDPRLLSY